jgi:pheromone alpha factor receptor
LFSNAYTFAHHGKLSRFDLSFIILSCSSRSDSSFLKTTLHSTLLCQSLLLPESSTKKELPLRIDSSSPQFDTAAMVQMASPPHLPPPVDPFAQPVTVLLPNGVPFNVTMDQITGFLNDRTVWGINIGAGIGASFLMLAAVALLTRADKRNSPVFVLNILALLINSIRGVLHALYVAGPFQNLYAVLTSDWTNIRSSDKAISIADATLGLLVLIVIEASLLMQVYVVLATTSRVQRFWVMAVCAAVALVAISVEFAVVVINCGFIMSLRPQTSFSFVRLVMADYIMGTVSVGFFCLVFLYKLGVAVLQRRRLGLKRFGPMQIIFIMAWQTMLIPSKCSNPVAIGTGQNLTIQ